MDISPFQSVTLVSGLLGGLKDKGEELSGKGLYMKLSTYLLIGLLLGMGTGFAQDDGPEVEFHPLHFGIHTTFGKMHGDTVESYGAGGGAILDDQPLVNYSGWFMLSATVEDRLDLAIVVGGLGWYSLPQVGVLAHTKYKFMSVGVGEASGTFKFGDLENPFLKLKTGLFQHKYSPSNNLGEYLYRSGVYPGYLRTGGFTILNTANYQAHGVLADFSLLNNSLNLNVSLFFERDLGPQYDLSPGIDASYNIANIVEIGGGFVWSHLISMDEDVTTLKKRSNAYFNEADLDAATYWDFDSTVTGVPIDRGDFPLTGKEPIRPGFEFNGFGMPGSDTIVVPVGDPRLTSGLPSTDPRYDEVEKRNGFGTYLTPETNGIPTSKLKYYTSEGQKVTVWFKLSPLSSMELNGFEKSNIYGELAVLGIKDYPFYYDDISERMPKMFGMNIQAMNRFSLSIELEFLKTRFRNDFRNKYGEFENIWHVIDHKDFADTQRDDNSLDLFYSVNAKYQATSYLAFSLQYALDHLRTNDYYGNPSYEPALREKENYYWVFNVQMGI